MEMMTPEEAAEAAKGMTFEKIWLMLMEDRMKWEESELKRQRDREETELQRQKEREESEQKHQKEMEEIFRQIKESGAEVDKRMARTDRRLGRLSNSLGEFMEAFFSGDLCEKFDDLGFEFTSLGPNKQFREGKRDIAEVDFFLENGEVVMAVEVKSKLRKNDIDEQIKRIGIIRRYMDQRNDRRKIIGAAAGGVVPDEVLRYAHEQGFYMLIQTGDSVEIADLPEGFKAREW